MTFSFGPDHIAKALNEAEARVLANATSHSDANDAETLSSANSYTDSEIAKIPPVDLTDYATVDYVGTEVGEVSKRLDQEAVDREKADQDLQNQIDAIESVTHRAEWILKPINNADPVPEGEMSWRDPGAQGWAGVLAVRIHHEDKSGRVHPMGTVQSGNLFMIEWADNNDVIQGSAVYVVGTIRSNSEWIDFDPASMVHASGQPPAIGSGQVMKLVFTPADSGSGDYWTKQEADARFHIVGGTDNVLLNNGGLKSQSYWLVKGSNTNIQLANGETLEQSTFSKTGHTHSGYASSSHSHSGYASSSHTHNYASSGHSHSSYISKTDSNKKILQADGTIGPVKFTKSGTALYWE